MLLNFRFSDWCSAAAKTSLISELNSIRNITTSNESQISSIFSTHIPNSLDIVRFMKVNYYQQHEIFNYSSNEALTFEQRSNYIFQAR